MAEIKGCQCRLWGHPLLAQGSLKTALCSSNLILHWGNAWAPLCHVCCQEMLLQARDSGITHPLLPGHTNKKGLSRKIFSVALTRGFLEARLNTIYIYIYAGNTSSFQANLQTQAANPDVMLKALHVWQVRLYYKQSLWGLLEFTPRVLWSHSFIEKKLSPLYSNTQKSTFSTGANTDLYSCCLK